MIQKMKAICFFILTLCFTALSFSAKGADKIQGAFGKNLGDVFDTAYAIATTKLTDGTTMYEFSPTTGFRSFHNYYVLITPASHKIYGIWGTGKVQNTEIGQKEQSVIMAILQRKYGNEGESSLLDTMSDVRRIDQGKRSVMTQVAGLGDVLLKIQYYDADLQKLAETERISIETKKADSSGL